VYRVILQNTLSELENLLSKGLAYVLYLRTNDLTALPVPKMGRSLKIYKNG